MDNKNQQPGRPTLKIACVGEAMIELSVSPDSAAGGINASMQTQLGFAGDTLNTAIYLKRIIGSLADVAYVTRVGEDVFSEQLLAFIRSENLATHAIERSTSKTPGLYAITTDDHGERSFTYWRDNSAAKDLFQTHQGFSFAVLSQFDVIFFSGISLAILPATARDAWLDWLAEHRQQVGKTIVFDSNYRPRLWGSEDEARHYMSRAWSVATIALPSVDDEQLLHGDATDQDVIDRIRALGVPAGVLKRGAEGPVGFDSNALYEATQTTSSALSVNVVDTTAAGDSFNGAYIASLLMGESPQTALVAAHQCALKVIGFRGAIVPKESFKASP